MGVINWLQLGLTFLIFLISMFFGTLGVMWKFGQAVGKFREDVVRMNTDLKADFDAKLLMFEKENEARVGRVYERFDQYKTTMEAGFVRKEMCSVVHAGTASAIVEMKAEFGKKFDSLGTKVDALLMRDGSKVREA